MAATSAMSSETMAVTGLVTYDIYRTYVNPKVCGYMIIPISMFSEDKNISRPLTNS